MTFTNDAWHQISSIREAIDALPLLRQMEEGTLDRNVFDHYLVQDAHYLADYGRALTLAASRASDPDELIFWTQSAHGAVVNERQLHESRVGSSSAEPMSPVCTAYTSYLLALGAKASYPVQIAGILPCFWIYEDVGRRMLGRLQDSGVDLEEHPYGDWISTYGDADFAAATERAKEIVDQQAARATPQVCEEMLGAFVTASRYEWMFWDAPMRLETWPV